MYNPFDDIDERLKKIEENQSYYFKRDKPSDVESLKVDFKYFPILSLFEQKICSKPTFYKFLKQGRYDLYKFGDRSFVLLEEFYTAFNKVSFKKKKGGGDP